MKAPAATEAQIQRAVAQVLDAAGVLWCHVPNGGKRDRITAAIMSGHGVKPGVPDVLIFTPPRYRPTARGCAIELKTEKGTPTEAQADWIDRLTDLGWLCDVSYGLDQALFILRRWGYIK